jgi:protease I
MTKQALFIVAQNGYQDYEYGIPKKILEDAGINTITASKEVGPCKGSHGGTTEATISLAEINVDNYDTIIFIGGPGATAYQHDVQAHLTAQESINRNKILAAICIAPTILAYADVLEGKKATVWNEDNKQAEILTKNGAIFTDQPVVTDGKIITANGPPAAEEFGKKILELLQG